MNNHERGNLALQMEAAPDYYPYSSPAPWPYPDYEAERKKREQRLKRLQYESSVYSQYKQGTRARSRYLSSLIIVIVTAAVVLGFSVWRYAKIVELNFSNVRITRQIKELQKENSLLQNAIASKMCLEDIRKSAHEEIGLQEANSGQIIQIDFSASDKVIFIAGSAHNEKNIEFAIHTVEDWVSRQQSQP